MLVPSGLIDMLKELQEELKKKRKIANIKKGPKNTKAQ